MTARRVGDGSEAIPPGPRPLPATVPELLREASERYGESVFVVGDADELSYAEAERASGRLARWLLAHGVGKGSRVGILMPNGVRWVVAWYALTRIGAVAVPINTFYKPKELAWVVRHADLTLLLTNAAFRTNDYVARLEEALPGLRDQRGAEGLWIPAAPFLRSIVVFGAEAPGWATGGPDALNPAATAPAEAEVSGEFLAAVESTVTPSDDAVIIYTSGSTGEPKGPVHSQGVVVAHSRTLSRIYDVRPDDVIFTSMPFFWVGGLIAVLQTVIHHGATIVTQAAFDAEEALDLIEKHRATVTLGWPQQGVTLAECNAKTPHDLSAVRRTSMPAMVAPERRPPEVASGQLGMTELCGNHLGVDPYRPLPEFRRGTFGPSIEGLEHRIVDPVTKKELPRRAEGEIWVRGYSLMQRLYKRERHETFTPDGFYATGDAGWMDEDGWITFTGRLGDMIKTSTGTNVTPAEVEEAIATCPGVLESFVVGVHDPAGGGEVVGAAVVPVAGVELQPEEVRLHVRGALATYKVPRMIWVGPKAELPFGDTGKVKKKELAALIDVAGTPV